MTVKRKDFQKTAAYIHEFLLKLSEDPECAEVRDALNLALLYMQKYYRYLQTRSHTNDVNRMSGSGTFSVASVRGLSPMTPFRDAPDKFVFRWVNLEQTNNHQALSKTLPHGKENGMIYSVPLMHQACKTCDLDTMDTLYQKQPHLINELDALGRTPIMYGIHYGHNDTVRWLLDHGCDVNATSHDEATALHWACHDGNWQAVDLLLRFDADHRKADIYGRCPIHWAVTTPTVQCLKHLIHYNANVNIRDKDGLSPSMWACRLDNIEHFSIISQVTNQQIDETDGMERDRCGRTWLHWAVRRTEPLECLKTLLSNENVGLRDDDGKTVMLIAAETGSLAACRLIVETAGKESIHDRDDGDRTPLHLATIGGHGEVVNYLLEMGGDTESRDKTNATAWDYAFSRHLQYCMLIIASHCRQRGTLCQDTPSPSVLGIYSENGDNKPKTPPRPPTTPPPRDKSPTPRRYLKKPMESSTSPGGVYNGRPNGPLGMSSDSATHDYNRVVSEEECDRGFDRRESEELPINSFGDGSPPLAEANGAGDDVDHVSIENMNVSDLDDDGSPPPPPVSSRRATERPAERPTERPGERPDPYGPRPRRPTSGRQLTRAQPPPRLQRPSPASPPAPGTIPSPGASAPIARAEVLEDEPMGQPPRTPPEAKRKPVLPPQLVPLNTPPKREKKKKKKRRNRDLAHMAMVARSPVSSPIGTHVMEVGGVGLGSPSSSDPPLANGALISGLGGGGGGGSSPGYTRPLQPPVAAARSSTQTARLPLFGGGASGGGSGLEESTTSLTPRQEVIPPPRGFRNDSSNETTPREGPSYASANRKYILPPHSFRDQDTRSGNQNKSPLAQLSPNGRAVTAQAQNQRLSYLRRK